MLRWRSRGWLVLLCAAFAGLNAVAACGDDSSPTAPAFDSGLDPDATGGAGICPTIAPAAGEPCTLPEGTTCAFGACGTPIAECRGGAWRYGGNPPQPLCPEPEPPPSGSACPPCWPANATCTYGACSASDASTNTAIASCPNGTWVLEFTACPFLDAGADVQGDSGADAD